MNVKIIVGYLRLMQRVLQHYQLDLQKIGVPDSLIEQFQNYLADDQHYDFNAEQYSHLLIYLQKQFERPISLVVAEQVALQDAGLIGYLASTSVDLQQALLLLQTYYPLLYKKTNLAVLNLEERQDSIKVYWTAQQPDWRYFCELELAILYRVAKLIVQNELIAPDYVMLGYTTELSLVHYQKFFHCPVNIQTHHHYGIQFPKQILQTRSIAADKQLNQVLSSQAQQSLDRQSHVEQQHQFKQKIIALLEQGLKQQYRLQVYVADQLHYSERTLQRHLKQYGLNFQEVVDEYRMQKSMQYLQQGKSFTEIAELLNYADQSAFGRAFKRWTGYTPKQYLKNM